MAPRGVWPHPGMHKPGMVSEKLVPYRAALSKNGSLKIKKEANVETAVIDFPADTINHFSFPL